IQEESADRATWGEILSHKLRRPLYVGLGLAVFQQITGINAVIYYANEIFAAAGFTTAKEQADATLFAVGGVNVLATFIAIAFVDKFGRKPLLLTGLVGMSLSLTTLGFAFAALDGSTAAGTPTTLGIITLVCLVVFIASFAFSMGPIVWTMISEIYPNRIRGRAVAVATAANWGAAFLVSMTFLTLLDAIGESATFWLFAATSVAAFVWIWFKVPETKGRSLEQISEVFDHAPPRPPPDAPDAPERPVAPAA
ncbi:MAG: MFS transporter, partial [Acidimicrobiales bacterium]